MKRIVKPSPPVEAPPAPAPHLSDAERAELQRQGAKAAARGESTDTNPLGRPCNKPLATGESTDKWLQRSDAWEEGHEAQSEARRNTEPSASQGGSDRHD